MAAATEYEGAEMNVVEFLLARITEDETAANAATEGPWSARTTGRAGGDHWYICDTGEAIAHISAQDGINEDQREPDANHIALHDPARVLAECKAKRALLATHALKYAGSGTSIDPDHREVGCETCNWDTSYWWLEYGPCDTLKALAVVYADHPDYNQEWKI